MNIFPLAKCTHRLSSGSEGSVSLRQPRGHLGKNPVVRQVNKERQRLCLQTYLGCKLLLEEVLGCSGPDLGLEA